MDNVAVSVSTFNKMAKQYQDKYMQYPPYEQTYDVFCQLLHKPQAEVLELGCGPGNITHYLLNKLPELVITATDLAPNMVTLAKANNPQARVLQLDCRDVINVAGRFDAVICGFCIPYISQYEVIQLLDNITKKLHPGGLLYLSFMDDDEAESGFQTSKNGEQVYIYYHPLVFIEAQLVKHGFSLLHTITKNYMAVEHKTTTDAFIIAKLSSR
ncbi:class I SAM-dependent DNA methyltransferase [Shewanella gaetbuli]